MNKTKTEATQHTSPNDRGHSGKSLQFTEQWDSAREIFNQQKHIHISILVLLKKLLYKDEESNT